MEREILVYIPKETAEHEVKRILSVHAQKGYLIEAHNENNIYMIYRAYLN